VPFFQDSDPYIASRSAGTLLQGELDASSSPWHVSCCAGPRSVAIVSVNQMSKSIRRAEGRRQTKQSKAIIVLSWAFFTLLPPVHFTQKSRFLEPNSFPSPATAPLKTTVLLRRMRLLLSAVCCCTTFCDSVPPEDDAAKDRSSAASGAVDAAPACGVVVVDDDDDDPDRCRGRFSHGAA
jgi:hypothetical protein